MQILKVLLVVLVVVNLTTGFFFKKKKKVYVHQPAPVYPQYVAPYPYTYSYYYQPIPYYYYEPVHAAPAISAPPAPPVAHPLPAPPAPPVAPSLPALPAAPAPPPVHVTPVVASVPPAPSPDPLPATHLSVMQALPVFEPVSFTGSSSNVEIIPSVGFQMGTKTDVIEVHKSQGKYIELPSEAVPADDADSTASFIAEINKDVVVDKPQLPAQTTLIKLNNDVPEQLYSLPVPVPKSAVVETDSTAGYFVDNSQPVDSGAVAIDVRTADENDDVPAVVSQSNDSTGSVQLTEQLILPGNDGISDTEATFVAVPNVEPLSDALLSARVSAQGSTSTAVLVDESGSSAVDALTFPEVQQLLNELIKHEEFNEKRLARDTTASGDTQPTKSVEIDPQVSYSRVVRQ